MNNGQEPASKADIEALREQILDTETKLLRAFYDFARRLLEGEKRLNMPPAA